MKKKVGFLASLGGYGFKLIERNPLPYTWVGGGFVIMVLLSSFLNVKNSNISTRNTREAIEKAAARGDYELASRLFEQRTENVEYLVLGAESELDDKVYPEKVVERKIGELEDSLAKYPNHFEILLGLSRLTHQIGQEDKSLNYREMARALDPNNVIFK